MLRNVLFLSLFFMSFANQAGTILVIESYHAEYNWVKSYRAGIEEVLANQYDLVHFEMDTKRLPESQYQGRADSAWALYQDIQPQLVILADDNALKYLAPKFLKTDIPVVYLGINANPRKYGVADASNFSGVIERPLLMRSIHMLKKFMSVKKALLLLDSGETSKVLRDDIFYGNNSIVIGGITVDLKLVKGLSEWKQHVLTAKIQGYDVLIPALYHVLFDENGNHIDPEEVIHWTSENTDIPPFGFWGFSIGADKNAGGYVVFGYEEGKLAAQIALGMLNEGKNQRVRPRVGGQGRFMFSTTQLDKWGLKLPETILQQAVIVD